VLAPSLAIFAATQRASIARVIRLYFKKKGTGFFLKPVPSLLRKLALSQDRGGPRQVVLK